MSQYVSRIHIKVSTPEIWSRFEQEDDAGFNLARLAQGEETSFIIDGDWSCEESELTCTVEALAHTLDRDGIIIADTTNINVDPYDYCILWLGDFVRSEEFSSYTKSQMFDKTNIEDIPGWLNYGGFRASKEEKAVLLRCGIAMVGKRYVGFSNDLKIRTPIRLRYTSFEERAQTIEKLSLGDRVTFVLAPGSEDPLRVEAMSEYGSLGYLPSQAGEQLAPLLGNELMQCTAKIVELVPLSKRNPHAKSSIVGLEIGVKENNHE